MSNALESDGAMVMNLESFGVRVDGAGYDETETEPGANLKFDKPAVKIVFQVGTLSFPISQLSFTFRYTFSVLQIYRATSSSFVKPRPEPPSSGAHIAL